MKIFWLLSTKNTNNNVNILKLKNLQRILKSDITKGTITRNENEDKGTGIFFQGVTIASMMLFDRPGYDGVDEGLITRGRRGVAVERTPGRCVVDDECGRVEEGAVHKRAHRRAGKQWARSTRAWPGKWKPTRLETRGFCVRGIIPGWQIGELRGRLGTEGGCVRFSCLVTIRGLELIRSMKFSHFISSFDFLVLLFGCVIERDFRKFEKYQNQAKSLCIFSFTFSHKWDDDEIKFFLKMFFLFVFK